MTGARPPHGDAESRPLLTRREAMVRLGCSVGGVGAVLALASSGCSTTSERTGETTPSGDPRRNIVVVLADDMRFDELPFLPTVSGLRAEGVEFVSARQPTSMCSPARAGFLRGQLANGPNGHGIVAQASNSAPLESDMLPIWLQASGYTTGIVGKYFVNLASRAAPGWDFWRTPKGDLAASAYGSTIVVTDGDVTSEVVPEMHQEQYFASQIVEFASTAAEPWFLWYCPNAPHFPFEPSPENADRWRDVDWDARPEYLWRDEDVTGKPTWIRGLAAPGEPELRWMRAMQRLRLAELSDLDDSVSLLLSALRTTGRLERTTLIITSDNGNHNLEHRIPIHTKNTPYDISMHVPMVMVDPGRSAGTVDVPVNAAADVTATCLEIAGASPTVPQDGVSLLRILEDPADFDDRFVLGYRDAAQETVPGMPSADIVYTGRQKLIRYQGVADPDRYEMYDLLEDPGELVNLAYQHDSESERDELAQRLEHVSASPGG